MDSVQTNVEDFIIKVLFVVMMIFNHHWNSNNRTQFYQVFCKMD